MNTAISLNPPWDPGHSTQPSGSKDLASRPALSATSWGPAPNHKIILNLHDASHTISSVITAQKILLLCLAHEIKSSWTLTPV